MPGLSTRYSGTCATSIHFLDSPWFGESPLGVTMATTGVIKRDWFAETCLGAEMASFSPVDRGESARLCRVGDITAGTVSGNSSYAHTNTACAAFCTLRSGKAGRDWPLVMLHWGLRSNYL